jgi:Rps23 Pro-64 3,4-dihydroxylase Tpa1-like proline 4-hydroxylase
MPTFGMCGTFDVENFGDLLFPLLATHELNRRVPDSTVRCYSYMQRAVPDWPFAVRCLTDLGNELRDLDGLLIGGGHLVRFDKAIAPGYHPRTPGLHHPLSLWLSPALLAAQRGVPVAWNAVAALGRVPEWARALLSAALRASSYVAVRDAASQEILGEIAPDVAVQLVPDTAFGIGALIDRQRPSPALRACRASHEIDDRPYILLQATSGIDDLARAVIASAPPGTQILSVPIGPVLGDADELLHAIPGITPLRTWPHPLVLAELIAGAHAVVGTSLHLAIVAIASGVPVLRPQQVEDAKYTILDAFTGVHPVADTAVVTPAWLQLRFGPRAPEAQAIGARAALEQHWDRVVQAFGARRDVHSAMNDLWQVLPRELERMSRMLDLQQQRTAAAERSVVDLRNVIATLHGSLSWRITRPLRTLANALRFRSAAQPASPGPVVPPSNPWPRPVLRCSAVCAGKLATHPYGWARVDRLFSIEDGAALSTTFPRDRFKIVRGDDGEKGYAYHARGLVSMDGQIVHPDRLAPHWLRLARDLLSPEYRDAMSTLTGIDLRALRLEANAFHYGPGAWLGPHLDLADKIVTHVLYFNGSWDPADGGCFSVLRSGNIGDVEALIAPVIGSSVVLVRSDRSWHAVPRVDASCNESRRSVTVTFYRDGAISTLWPPGDRTPLADYAEDTAY